MTWDKDHPIRISRRQTLAGFGATVFTLALPGFGTTVAWADNNAPRKPNRRRRGYVYVNGNTPGTNTVVGFARDTDGSLTLLPGSPFPVGGAGTGVALGSQGAIQLAANERFLLAVDGGSNGISVSRIRPDGTLKAVSGSPFSSEGVTPVSIAVHGDLVYVANAGPGGANYAGFILRPNGHLEPLDGSTVALPDGAGIGDILFDAHGKHLIGIRVTTSLIDSFTVRPGGLLEAAPGSPFAAQAPGPFGSVFRPADPPQLFVSNAHGGSLAGSISAYTVTVDGTLNSIGTSPYPDQQTAPCWVALSPNGRYLYTANFGSNSISSYAVAPGGVLTLVGSTILRGASTLGTFDLGLDPTGRFLYQVDGSVREISALAATGGNLSELPSSPISLGLPANTVPSGIAII